MSIDFKQNNRYAIVDLEATRASYHSNGRIIQIGLVLVDGQEITGEYAWDINPEQKISESIHQLTGISNQRAKKAPVFAEVADDLWDLLADRTFVAHNIAFDYPMLSAHFYDVGMPELDMPGIDTLELLQIFYPEAPSYKLKKIADYIGIPMGKAHDAFEDALATAKLLLHIQAICANLPKSLQLQIQPFVKHLMGQTGEHLLSWLKVGEEKTEPYVIKEGFVLCNQTHVNTPTVQSETAKQKSRLNKRQSNFVKDLQAIKRTSTSAYALIEGTAASEESCLAIYAALAKKASSPVLLVSHTLLEQRHHIRQSLPLIEQWLGRKIHYANLKGSKHYLNLSALRHYLKQQASARGNLKKRDALRLLAILFWLTKTEDGDIDDLNSSLNLQNFIMQLNQEASMQHLTDDEVAIWGRHAFYQQAQEKARHAELIFLNQAYLMTHIKDLRTQFGLLRNCSIIIENIQQLPETVCQQAQISLDMAEIEASLARIQRGLDRLLYLNSALEREDIDYFSLIEALQVLWSAYDCLLDDWRTAYQKRSYYTSPDELTKGIYLGSLIKSPIYSSLEKFKQAMNHMTQLLWQLLKRKDAGTVLLIADSLYLEGLRLNLKLKGILQEQTAYVYTIKASWKEKEFYGRLLKQSLEAKDSLSKFFASWPGPVYLLCPTAKVLREEGLLERELGLDDNLVLDVQLIPKKRVSKCSFYVTNTKAQPDNEGFELLAGKVANQLQQLNAFMGGKWIVYTPNRRLRLLISDAIQLALPNNQSNILYHLERYHKPEQLAVRFQEAEAGILVLSSTASLDMYMQGTINGLLLSHLPFPSPNEPRELARENHCRHDGRSYFETFALPSMLMELGHIVRACYQQKNACPIYCLDARIKEGAYAGHIQYYLRDYITGPKVTSFSMSNKQA